MVWTEMVDGVTLPCGQCGHYFRLTMDEWHEGGGGPFLCGPCASAAKPRAELYPEHEPECPRSQFWDAGDFEARCRCDLRKESG